MSEQFDDLYQGTSDDFQNETRPLDEIIMQAISTAMVDVHTSLPAKVTVIRDTGYVDVQVMLKRKYTDGTLVDIPVIQNVPVMTPRGATWWFKPPLEVGDLGRVIFCERSIDAWKAGDGSTTIDPKDPRTFDLSDAVFEPGLYPISQKLPGNATDMVLHNDGATITLQKGGTFLIANDSNELLAVLGALVDTLISAKAITGIGPQPLTPDTIAALQGVKTDLDTLTGVE